MAQTYEEKLNTIRAIRAERAVREPSPAKKKAAAATKAKRLEDMRKALEGLSPEQVAALLGAEVS